MILEKFMMELIINLTKNILVGLTNSLQLRNNYFVAKTKK